MNFRDLNLKPRYSSRDSNLLKDFWVPILSHTVLYKRGVAYFRSDYLSSATKGLIQFIQNDGKALMICGIEFSAEDITAIKNGYLARNEVIERNLRFEIKKPLSLEEKSSLEILAWMIKNNFLDIKIAVKKNDFGIFYFVGQYSKIQI